MEYIKFPRIFHFSDSPGLQHDDKRHSDESVFEGKQVVGSIKLDGENCFEESTQITTEKGKIPIKEICDNNLKLRVLSQDVDNNVLELQPIEKTIITEERQDWFEITAEDGTVLVVTQDQLVWLPRLMCYRRVKDLKEGDEVLLN